MTETFTLDKLMAMKRKVEAFGPAPEFHVTPMATKDGERFFAESRHRSQRVEKKLVKRYGGAHRQIPAMYKVGNKMLIHPALWAEVRAKMEVRIRDTYEGAFYGNWDGFGGIRVTGTGL